jgi:hypothetical protein
MSSAGKWLRGAAWRLTPKAPSDAENPKLPGCFGDKQWLDRRTNRCKQCGFLAQCIAKIDN